MFPQQHTWHMQNANLSRLHLSCIFLTETLDFLPYHPTLQNNNKTINYKYFWSINQYYTCQLFLRCRREIFILGVLGFLKTTQSFPKTSKVCQRHPKSAEGEVIEKTLIHKIRDREEGIVIYSFYTWFSFVTWV